MSLTTFLRPSHPLSKQYERRSACMAESVRDRTAVLLEPGSNTDEVRPKLRERGDVVFPVTELGHVPSSRGLGKCCKY